MSADLDLFRMVLRFYKDETREVDHFQPVFQILLRGLLSTLPSLKWAVGSANSINISAKLRLRCSVVTENKCKATQEFKTEERLVSGFADVLSKLSVPAETSPDFSKDCLKKYDTQHVFGELKNTFSYLDIEFSSAAQVTQSWHQHFGQLYCVNQMRKCVSYTSSLDPVRGYLTDINHIVITICMNDLLYTSSRITDPRQYIVALLFVHMNDWSDVSEQLSQAEKTPFTSPDPTFDEVQGYVEENDSEFSHVRRNLFDDSTTGDTSGTGHAIGKGKETRRICSLGPTGREEEIERSLKNLAMQDYLYFNKEKYLCQEHLNSIGNVSLSHLIINITLIRLIVLKTLKINLLFYNYN